VANVGGIGLKVDCAVLDRLLPNCDCSLESAISTLIDNERLNDLTTIEICLKDRFVFGSKSANGLHKGLLWLMV